jgi:hypothetical protein
MGCLTVASCNGGFLGDHHHERHPLVVFYARAKDGPGLIKLAKIAQVGISDESGPLMVWANSIWNMYGFAKEIFDNKGSLKPKSKPFRQNKSVAGSRPNSKSKESKGS